MAQVSYKPIESSYRGNYLPLKHWNRFDRVQTRSVKVVSAESSGSLRAKRTETALRDFLQFIEAFYYSNKTEVFDGKEFNYQIFCSPDCLIEDKVKITERLIKQLLLSKPSETSQILIKDLFFSSSKPKKIILVNSHGGNSSGNFTVSDQTCSTGRFKVQDLIDVFNSLFEDADCIVFLCCNKEQTTSFRSDIPLIVSNSLLNDLFSPFKHGILKTDKQLEDYMEENNFLIAISPVWLLQRIK